MNYTSPNWSNAILMTIDTQNDFVLPDAPARIDGTWEVTSKIRELLQVFRQNNLPILHIIRLYKADGSNVDICRREAVEKGFRIAVPHTQGAELVDEIKPNNETRLCPDQLLRGNFQEIANVEWIMYKSRWGAFYRTNLEKFLRTQNIDTIIISGCNFPNCPRTTIYQASERDFRIVMAKDAISQTYERGIDEMRNIGVNLMDTVEIVQLLRNR